MADGRRRTYAIETAGGQRVIVRGRRLADAGTPPDLVLDAGDAELRPGLINAHDHLFLNHFPRLGTPPYANAYEWGRDLHARFGPAVARANRVDRRNALLFGALKNLLGAVTTVVHHDPWHPLLDGAFPVRTARVRVAHSLGFERDLAAAVAGDNGARGRPLSMHVAEGTDAVAAGEVRACEERGLLTDDFHAVHAVGVSEDDACRLRKAGAAVVWCPSSNGFLLERTVPRGLLQTGVDVLLGTDSLLTAEGTMLDELRVARRCNAVSDDALLDAVGPTAARRLGLPAPGLLPGGLADLVALRAPLLEARPGDVSLVIVDGLPRLGDARFRPVFDHCGVRTERLTVGGVPKLVAHPLATVARRCCEVTPDVGRILC